MQLRHAARTDVGKTRDHNEDSYGVETGRERTAGALFVVCDGIGGLAKGEVASQLAVQTIISRYFATSGRGPEAALKGALEDANRAVLQQGHGKIGTTTVAAVFREDALVVANVGDCRAYLIRDGKPRQITRDHSFVAEQVAAGMLTEAQARESSYRNVITRALGQREALEVDTFREPLLQNDIVVLCSDGLHGQVDADEIALAVTKKPLDVACERLIALANERGGPDNITIVAVQVVELMFLPESAPDRSTTSVAKTARLSQTGAVTTSAASPNGTQRLDAAVPADRRSGSDRRGHTDRRTQQQPVTEERRHGDRRSSQTTATAPPLAAPQPRSNPMRSFVGWLIGLLLLAAIVLGGYFYLVFQDNGGTVPVNPFVAPPTQTPLGDRATPTLIPTDTSPATVTP